jgi:ABC-2 type transport system permease protein
MSSMADTFLRRGSRPDRPFAIIMTKELKSSFYSPMGYIILGLFLLTAGFFMFSFPPFFLIGRAEMRNFFRFLPGIFAMAIPALTMRLFADEFRGGSFEILKTLPIRISDIVIGKFLASMAFIAFMLLPTLTYPILIDLISDFDWGPVIGGYVGVMFMAASLVSVGIFCSSLTGNQIIAFVLSALFSFFLIIVDKMIVILPNFLGGFFQYLSVGWHFENITLGILDIRDLFYFAFVSASFLYASALVIQERK